MDVFNEQVYIIKTQLNYTYSYIVWLLSDQKKAFIKSQTFGQLLTVFFSVQQTKKKM